MTKNRDFKRCVRTRMRKTGERYATARAQLLRRATPTLLAAAHSDDFEGVFVALALEANPRISAWPLWAELDQLTSEAEPPPEVSSNDARRLGHLLQRVFLDLGFAVPQEYADPELNLLDHVLETRRGTPAALAALLVVVGRRLGLELAPVAFPGHFLVRAELEGGPRFIDPASGCTLPVRDLLGLASQELDMDTSATDLLAPASARALATRLLRNLADAHRARGDDARGLVVADRLYELTGSARARAERGLFFLLAGAREAGLEDLRSYLSRSTTSDLPSWLDGLTTHH